MSDHVVFETESQHMLCRHCGAAQALRMPISMMEMVEAMEAFSRAHSSCPEPAVLPVLKLARPAPVATTKAIYAWPGLAAWLDEGERGTSSEVIVQVITGIPLGHDPCDEGATDGDDPAGGRVIAERRAASHRSQGAAAQRGGRPAADGVSSHPVRFGGSRLIA